MTKGQFIEYIESGCVGDETALGQLLLIAEQYPYSAAVQKVVLRFLSEDGDVRYDERLPLVAMVVRDRKKLHDYIHGQEVLGKNLKVVDDQCEPEKVHLPEVIEELEAKKFAISEKEYFEDISYTTQSFALANYTIGKGEEVVEAESARTFSDWLKHMEFRKKESFEIEDEEKKDLQSNEKWNLIDSFIKEQPEIKPPDSKEHVKVLRQDVEQSNQDSEEFMTETLAQIYIKQKHYDKALRIFEKLSLKYPEKNTYFAGQIKLIGQLKNNEKE